MQANRNQLMVIGANGEKIAAHRTKMTLGRKLFIIGMIIVPIINLLVFYVGVNFESILMAFRQTKKGEVIYSLKNFEMLFDSFGMMDSVMSEALKNTLLFYFYGLIIETPIILLLSYFLYKKIAGYKVFRIIFFLPSIISGIVMAMLYRYLLSVDGPVAMLLEKILGLSTPPEILADSRYAIWACVFYSTWAGVGTSMLYYTSAMSRIPPEVLEAAKLDGVGWLREWWQIIIPLIWPTLSTLLLLGVSGLFTASGPILLLTKGAYKTNTISFWMYMQVLNQSNLEYASAVGLFYTMLSIPVVLFARWILKKFDSEVEY